MAYYIESVYCIYMLPGPIFSHTEGHVNKFQLTKTVDVMAEHVKGQYVNNEAIQALVNITSLLTR